MLFLVTTACSPTRVELARNSTSEPLCEAELAICDSEPRCADGSSNCEACQCCACEEGEVRCDPEYPVLRWRCVDGCFVNDRCNFDEVCSDNGNGTADCVPTEIDCDRLTDFTNFRFCEAVSLCEICGGCQDCTGVDLCFDEKKLLICVDVPGLGRCFEPRNCEDTCVEDIGPSGAGCSDP